MALGPEKKVPREKKKMTSFRFSKETHADILALTEMLDCTATRLFERLIQAEVEAQIKRNPKVKANFSRK